jgi:hypothetical protein
MFMRERHARKLQEREHLQPIAVVVGDAEQFGVGVEREHWRDPALRERHATDRIGRSCCMTNAGGAMACNNSRAVLQSKAVGYDALTHPSSLKIANDIFVHFNIEFRVVEEHEHGC